MRTILPHRHRLVPDYAKKVFQGQLVDVYQWEQELYDGSTAIFEMLKRHDAIQVLAIKDHKLVVLKEEQPSMGAPFFGIPGGRHDVATETELDAAKRELVEETGMRFKNWRLIQVVQPDSKTERMFYTFLATGFVSQGPVHLDPGEKIEIQLLDHAATLKLAKNSANRGLPLNILEKITAIDQLADLPEFVA